MLILLASAKLNNLQRKRMWQLKRQDNHSVENVTRVSTKNMEK